MQDLERELTSLLNKYSAENSSSTPGFILAEYLRNCLTAFTMAIQKRDRWYGSNVPMPPAAKPKLAWWQGWFNRGIEGKKGS